MSFRITGLDAEPFRHLYGLSDSELAARGAIRYVAESKPGYPDRVELRDVEPGESVLLVNYEHQPVDSPYRASHAIFVREGAEKAYNRVGEVPQCMRGRTLSLRAFDDKGLMVDADLVEGDDVEAMITRMFDNPNVDYIHAHNARRGCYAARIDRA
jgi:hypothetical protein